MSRMLVRLVLLASVVIGPVRAFAQPAPASPAVGAIEAARKYTDDGIAAQKAGKYDAAIALFEKAYALTKHPLFSLTAPNKVRALVGNFALMNPVQFNRPDGGGYMFVIKQVLAIDGFNPQIAARLVPAFGRWKRFEPKRSAMMRASLERIVATPGLSKDVFEQASKSLA